MYMSYLRFFYPSFIVTAIGLVLGLYWGGLASLLVILLLSILEISLSFDNAVINAKILQNMSRRWQRRFLTWGLIIAVFGVRIIFPILVVCIITGIGFVDILHMAFKDPAQYSLHLHQAHTALASFGGMFLWMVFVSFIFDANRSIYWLGRVEKKLSDWGQLPSIEIIVALLILLILQAFVPSQEKLTLFVSGLFGIILFMIMHTLTVILGKNQKVINQGLAGFLYLELLDASFSMDGVMGGFAITKDLILIIIGLTIGAMFVRSLTLFFVRRNTLQKYQYLEHGAHYAVGALAVLMLLSIVMPISELITGCIGVSIIAISVISSIFNQNKVRLLHIKKFKFQKNRHR